MTARLRLADYARGARCALLTFARTSVLGRLALDPRTARALSRPPATPNANVAGLAFIPLLACGQSPLEAVPGDRPELEGVVLTVGEAPDRIEITLASAWMDPDGSGGHGVDATATVPGPPPLVITGKQSAWDLKKGEVVFDGGVTAIRADVTITCARLEVTYAGDKVDVARASGDVHVNKGAREATGDTAVLTVADGRVDIGGSPAIRDGRNLMTGSRIVLFLDDERLLCDDCRLEVAGDAVTPR